MLIFRFWNFAHDEHSDIHSFEELHKWLKYGVYEFFNIQGTDRASQLCIDGTSAQDKIARIDELFVLMLFAGSDRSYEDFEHELYREINLLLKLYNRLAHETYSPMMAYFFPNSLEVLK